MSIALAASAILGALCGVRVKEDTRLDDMYIVVGFMIFAALIALMIGREFSDGGFRNKITSGHTKGKVFFSEYILALTICLILTCVATGAFAILNTSAYNIEKKQIKLVPITSPISSYYYEINDEYRKKLEERFWTEIVPTEFNTIYDTATFDIDNDGVEEICTMSYGQTSGLFTFIFNAREVGKNDVEYHTIIYSKPYDLSFQKGSDGITRVQGITQGENPETHLFDISIKDGYVYLTENGVYIGEIN